MIAGMSILSSGTPPVGLEVHALVFAFNAAGPIGNATFYKYDVYYKGKVPLTDAYMALYSDPDLGNFQDDWVGSDTAARRWLRVELG